MTARIPHLLEKVTFPRRRSPDPSSITCSCGAHLEALQDPAFPDPNEPIVRQWLAHRLAVGAGAASVRATPQSFAFGRQAIPGTAGSRRTA